LSIIIELNEASDLRRRVPCRIFNSDGTSPDTGAQGDAVIMAVNSFTTISLSSALTAVHAAQGMYMEQLSQSNVSVLGTHMLYHMAGDFPQHIATIQVVNSNPFSTQSNLLVNSIAAGNYSGVSVEVKSGGIQVASIGMGNYSGVSQEILTGGIQTNSIGKGSYSGVTFGIDNIKPASYSGVTVGIDNIKAGSYSGVTVGIDNIKAGSYSGVTVQGVSNYANLPLSSIASSVWSAQRSDFTNPGSFGEYAYSQVTGISSGTVFGVTDTSNFPSGNGSGATAGEIARAVWANSGRTLDGTSIATIFTHPRSIWSTLRSDYTTPGSFGEYVYSQVTGTSTGTVQGVTRALNLSANGDKTGYSISGTKTTLDALNDIDGSGVTLHVGTHSGATIQGVTRLNSSVTLNANTHSGATIAGIVDGGIIASTLASGVITSAKFAASAIDAAALATDAGQEIADRVLGRNIAGGSDGGRTVSEALYPLRNRSLVQGSVGTVFGTDDSTSAWTFSPSLGTAPLSGIDPTT